VGELTVRFTGVSEAIGALRAWAEREKSATERAVQEAAEVVTDTAKGLAPHVTGALAESITITAEGEYTRLTGPTVVYGRIIELGGTITPRDRRYLSWLSDWMTGTGDRVFAKRVHIRPEPYLRPAVEADEGRILDTFREAWEAAAAE